MSLRIPLVLAHPMNPPNKTSMNPQKTGTRRSARASPLDGRPRRAENFDPEHLLAQSKQQWF